jgi:tetratricopeptide (TPR) repeat protein
MFRCCGSLLVLLALAATVLRAQTPDAVATRAIQQIQAGDFGSAAAALRAFLRPSSPQAELWSLLGVCESELNHPDAARQAFGKALELGPDSVSVRENAGLFYFRQGDYRAAREHLAKAIALGSDQPGVAFSLAAAQLRTGEKLQAVASLKRLEPSLSNSAEYWDERGWAELPDDARAAAASFDRALAISPGDSRALNGRASAAEAQGRDEEALSYLLRAKKAHPDELRTLLHFTSVCLRRDLSVDALRAVEHARKLAPSNNLALFLHARVEIAFQQWQESYNLFTEFDRRVPRYAPAQYALGWLDVKLNRPAEARAHLEQALALDPGSVEPRYELGQLELNDGNSERAETLLREVLAKEPRHAKANLAMGDLLVRQGKLEEAKRRYGLAIDSDPKSGPAHYKLSTVLLRLQDRERAEKERALGAALNAEAFKTSKVVLVLAEPDGTLLTGAPRP